MPNRWISALFCLLLYPAALGAQDDTAAQKRYAGTWQAKFNGAVFLTVWLEAGAKLSGTLSAGRITVDGEGELTEAEPPPDGRESDLMHTRLEGERLTFEIEDNGELTKFEMRLTANGLAELRFVGAPVKIKPIRLGRA